MSTHDEPHEELAVDATFEDALDRVAEAAAAYLGDPQGTTKALMVEELQRLDDQIAQSDAYGVFSIGTAFGIGPDGVGDSSAAPSAVEDVEPATFQAQAALVRAAKDDVRAGSDATLAALRAAHDALERTRGSSPS